MMAPTLTTDRLVLRALSMTDWEPYAAMWADERTTTFIGGTPRLRDVAWAKFCQSAGLWSLLGYGYWSVILRDRDAFIGIAGFAQFERGYPALEGYPEAGWAFAPDVWGQGYASETVAAFVAWGDANLNVNETRCMIDHGNFASVAVAVRNGYVESNELAIDMPVFRRPAPSV